MPAATIRQTSLRIEGDLAHALGCAQAEDQVVVFWAQEGDMNVHSSSPDASLTPSADRLEWERELGTASEVVDVALVLSVETAASASGARVLHVSVLALRDGQHVPVVTLEHPDPASYMKHDLRGFLDRIGYLEPQALGFVELLDEDGRFAWSAGRFPGGGMVHPRPDLDQCSPIFHSQLVGVQPPPCPAD